jgi:ribosomal protein S18 acetylase RimI-like enzyme
LAVAIRRLDDAEARARERDLVQHLTSWVRGSISARRFSDIDETIRVAVWSTVRHPERTVVLAEQTGQPVGILLGALRETPHRQYGFVEWVAVDPSGRRAGVASALVTTFATALGVDRLEGSVDLDDPVASAFWEREGWTRLRPPPRRVMMGGPVMRTLT